MMSPRSSIGGHRSAGAALAAVAAAIGLLALASTTSAAAPTAISIVDRSFMPADATIQVGDTITWTVTKAIADPHSVTSGTPSDPSHGQQFDSGITLRNNGDTYSHTFDTAGTFAYYCTIHPADMHGTITVLAAGGQSGPPPSGAPATSSAPATSAAPASSGPVGSAGPTGSVAPGSSPAPAPEVEKPPISSGDKLIAAGILGATLVILFGAAAFYRRVNG